MPCGISTRSGWWSSGHALAGTGCLEWGAGRVLPAPADRRSMTMGPFPRPLPGLAVGLFRIMFGLLWLDMALQKAPWVINQQGQRFGWLANWIWTEMQHPTFGFY